MNVIFKRYKKRIIAFGLLFVIGMTLGLVRIEYSLTAPGFTTEVQTVIEIDEPYEMDGTIQTTSVIAIDKITLLQYILGTYDDSVYIKAFPEYYDNVDLDELQEMSYLMKSNSIYSSLIVGMSASNETIEYEQYYTVFLTYDYLDEDSLQLGDKIVAVNDNILIEEVLNDTACNDVVTFDIIRDGNAMTVQATKNELENGTCAFGVYLKYFTEITNSTKNYTINSTNTGGPSGGLMQALYIYNVITENDITKGYDIAGTGTIDINGNVGAIGGIEQKVLTAHLNQMDVFFVPHLSDNESDNYIRALAIYNTLDTTMELVGVSTFDEALLYLQQYNGGTS